MIGPCVATLLAAGLFLHLQRSGVPFAQKPSVRPGLGERQGVAAMTDDAPKGPDGMSWTDLFDPSMAAQTTFWLPRERGHDRDGLRGKAPPRPPRSLDEDNGESRPKKNDAQEGRESPSVLCPSSETLQCQKNQTRKVSVAKTQNATMQIPSLFASSSNLAGTKGSNARSPRANNDNKTPANRGGKMSSRPWMATKIQGAGAIFPRGGSRTIPEEKSAAIKAKIPRASNNTAPSRLRSSFLGIKPFIGLESPRHPDGYGKNAMRTARAPKKATPRSGARRA